LLTFLDVIDAAGSLAGAQVQSDVRQAGVVGEGLIGLCPVADQDRRLGDDRLEHGRDRARRAVFQDRIGGGGIAVAGNENGPLLVGPAALLGHAATLARRPAELRAPFSECRK
jgi:hypothetical protein